MYVPLPSIEKWHKTKDGEPRFAKLSPRTDDSACLENPEADFCRAAAFLSDPRHIYSAPWNVTELLLFFHVTPLKIGCN